MKYFAILLGLISFCLNCSGGNSLPEAELCEEDPTLVTNPSEFVVYEGDVLIVRGQSYFREESLITYRGCASMVISSEEQGNYMAREVVVGYEEGQQEEIQLLIEDLGLSIIQLSSNFLVEVPILFEAQWAEALSQEELIPYAGLNTILYPTDS